MRIQDLKGVRMIAGRVRPVDSEQKLQAGSAKVEFGSISGVYDVIVGGTLVNVRTQDSKLRGSLDHFLSVCPARLAVLQAPGKDGSFELRVYAFNGAVEEFGTIQVGIDERIEATARRKGLRFKDAKDLKRVLADRFALRVSDGDGDIFFVFSAGPSARGDFEDIDTQRVSPGQQKPAGDAAPERPDVPDPKCRCFCIHGDRLRLPVEFRAKDASSRAFFASSLMGQGSRDSDNALRLARGTLEFCDYTKTGSVSALMKGMMSSLTAKKESYLRQWDVYGDREGELLLQRARSVGVLHHSSAEGLSGGIKLFYDKPLPEDLSENDELLFPKSIPDYLRNPSLTWEGYRQSLEEDFFQKGKRGTPVDRESEHVAKIKRMSSRSLVVDLPEPPDVMHAVLSIEGDKIQIERRMGARVKVQEGRSANPLLGALIEENAELPCIPRPTNHKPLTPFVREKVFSYDPTERQVKAIKVALNTPDIALIQGPPGTGKTTVITAIIERLNEICDKTDNIKGQILVTGFQHDAVENIVSRLRINSLLSLKFGKRSGELVSGSDVAAERLGHWCQDITAEVRKRNPTIRQTEHERRLQEMLELYSVSPSLGHALSLLKEIMALSPTLLSVDVQEKAQSMMKALENDPLENDPAVRSRLAAVRALRVKPEAFADDGPARASLLLAKMSDELLPPERERLIRAVSWRPGQELSFLSDLKEFKLRMLEHLSPKPAFAVEKPRVEILNLVSEVKAGLSSRARNGKNRTLAILADYLHELENNLYGVMAAVADYNFVYAATCQQAEGSPIRRAKRRNARFSPNEQPLTYDTVIVDEAARTSPRDLLIPMVQATKRIILVGDHRQLPHHIDEAVARALERGEDDELYNTDFIKQSMFQYLFKRLEDLEERDGIQRTVKLDVQFRMHPLLGKFVSDQFYYSEKPDGAFDERFKSRLKAGKFVHGLPGADKKAAAWLDVPLGKERRSHSKSRYRDAEVGAISNQLKDWIDSPVGLKLSFGVISFYREQANRIFKALSKHGMTTKNLKGMWEVSKEYRFLPDEQGETTDEERLRIGTVDSFQGMEFDVVFLSMVRSRKMPEDPPRNESKRAKLHRRLFGHLMSPNRLCVSMSRQKKLLVVVGDSSMVKHKLAEEAVPALCSFYRICEEEGLML